MSSGYGDVLCEAREAFESAYVEERMALNARAEAHRVHCDAQVRVQKAQEKLRLARSFYEETLANAPGEVTS